MRPITERPSRETVLDAFAVEPDPSRVTLEHYLRLYPEHAAALVDLSRELDREVADDAAPRSRADQALLDAAWTHHAAAKPAASVADPLAALTVDDWRAVAQRLNVPRQVMTALRERRVAITYIQGRILAILAEVSHSSIAQLEASWGSAPLAAARAYKADGKPAVGEQVSFEQVLIEAGVAPDERARLLADED